MVAQSDGRLQFWNWFCAPPTVLGGLQAPWAPATSISKKANSQRRPRPLLCDCFPPTFQTSPPLSPSLAHPIFAPSYVCSSQEHKPHLSSFSTPGPTPGAILQHTESSACYPDWSSLWNSRPATVCLPHIPGNTPDPRTFNIQHTPYQSYKQTPNPQGSSPPFSVSSLTEGLRSLSHQSTSFRPPAATPIPLVIPQFHPFQLLYLTSTLHPMATS